jgi:hypothetical protein
VRRRGATSVPRATPADVASDGGGRPAAGGGSGRCACAVVPCGVKRERAAGCDRSSTEAVHVGDGHAIAKCHVTMPPADTPATHFVADKHVPHSTPEPHTPQRKSKGTANETGRGPTPAMVIPASAAGVSGGGALPPASAGRPAGGTLPGALLRLAAVESWMFFIQILK